MKKILFALVLALAALTVNAKGERYDDVREDTVYTVHSINQDQFRDLIADWNARDWVMRSPRPGSP